MAIQTKKPIINKNKKVFFFPDEDRFNEEKKEDMVNHPSHYNTGKIEVIDFIEDQNLRFNPGNSVKYISRAGKKDKSKEIQDFEKAIWYLQREVSRLKKQQTT